jgi:hypothetical protein
MNGAGMMIKHTRQSNMFTPSRHIVLKNILHVPQASCNLAFIHRLTSDNDVFLELHPCFSLLRIKK